SHLCYPATARAAAYPLSLHDALPILVAGNIITNASTATPTSSNWFVSSARPLHGFEGSGLTGQVATTDAIQVLRLDQDVRTLTTDRKSTRLNSSHVKISYAVFCLKKK